jgi:4-amino-4-deoxy-L-arabinose transferase-like glycosyltransferase
LERAAPAAWDGFDRRDLMAAGAVFLFALILRLVYLCQIDSIPYYQFPIMDARSYDQWAQEIAAGDWLGKQAFYQAPAYPYLLGVIYRVFGHDLDIAHAVMMGIGSAGCALLFLATRVLFGFSAAVAAGALIALYPPAIFFDGLIGKASLGLLLISGMLLLLLDAQARPSRARFTAAGAVLGLLALTREHALVFAPAIPLWIVWRFGYVGGRARAAWSWVGAFLLGAALVLGPVALRNYVVGDTFALTTSQLGPNFFIGNNAEATGFYESLIPGRHTPDFESPDATRLAEHALGRSLTRGEVSDYWLGRGLDFVLQQPGDWLRLLGWKYLLTWNEFEIADTEDIYVYADWSGLLRGLHPLLHFGVLAPLAAAGIAFAWRRRRDSALLLWLVAVFSSSVALFMVFARMRYPLVPLLLPFAGYALVSAAALWREGELRRLSWGASALLATAFVCHLGLVEKEPFQVTAYTNLGGIMLSADRLDEAERYLEKAESIGHREVSLQLHLATLRTRQNRLLEAEAHLRLMLDLAPEDFRAHRLLAAVLRRQGREEEALPHRRRAAELSPEGRAARP